MKPTEEIAVDIESTQIKIAGTSKQQFLTATLVAFTGVAPMVIFSAPVANMNNLSQTLRSLLATAPVITSAATQIPMARYVANNGGIKAVRIMQGATLIGMILLTSSAATFDITTLNNFDWRYALMLASGCLVGLGTGTFQLIINAKRWAETEESIPAKLGTFGSVVDFTNALSPLITALLARFSFVAPYAIPFGLHTGLAALGGLATLCLQAPPYQQFRKTMDPDAAKQKAINFGQPASTIYESDNTTFKELAKENFKTLASLEGLVLNSAFTVPLSAFLGIGTFAPSMFKDALKLTAEGAIYVSSGAISVAILARLSAGWAISKFDRQTNGAYVYCASTTLSIASTIPIAFFNPPQWGQVVCIGLMSAGIGASTVPPVALAQPWSESKDKNSRKYNPDIMMGLLGTLGTLGTLLLAVISGAITDSFSKQNEANDSGLRTYFMIQMGLQFIVGLLMFLTDRHVRNVNNNTSSRWRFFSSNTDDKKDNLRIVELDNTDIQKQIQEEKTDKGLNGPK